jgi:hypothetical protein
MRRASTPSLELVKNRLSPRIAAALAGTEAAGPVVCFPGAGGALFDQLLLLRLGDRVAEGRDARVAIRRIVADGLAAWIGTDRDRFAMTSMPERYANRAEHTFISFARALADDIGIEFVNDRFIEAAPRRDIAHLHADERVEELRSAWRYRGALHGRTVILIDHVLATGASLSVASSILRDAGARVVPIALLELIDADAQTERVVQSRFGADYSALLGVPEIQGRLRSTIEGWIAGRGAPIGA